MAAMLAIPKTIYETNWHPNSSTTNHITPNMEILIVKANHLRKIRSTWVMI